jgi:hypothetical protein
MRSVDDEASERAFFHLLLAHRHIDDAFASCGFVQMSSYAAEDLVVAMEEFLIAWATEIHGRSAWEAAVASIPSALWFHDYRTTLRSTESIQLVEREFAKTFNTDLESMHILCAICAIYGVVVEHELNVMLQVWYQKNPPPCRAKLSDMVEVLQGASQECGRAFAPTATAVIRAANVYVANLRGS